MPQRTFQTDITPEAADSLVSAVRTSVGDTLRSVVYFTPSAFDVLYVRQDLYESDEAARQAKGRLVELERVGFAERPTRTAIARERERAGIGDYSFTVRFHENGFVVRLIEEDAGVVLTADRMDVTAFREAATAARRLLGGK
jgi:hypothetical protein